MTKRIDLKPGERCNNYHGSDGRRLLLNDVVGYKTNGPNCRSGWRRRQKNSVIDAQILLLRYYAYLENL